MIHLIETIEAIAGKEKELAKALLELVPLSRKEEGCIRYDLFQEENAPETFMVFMSWTDHEALDKHNISPHIEVFVEKFEDVLYHSVVETTYRELN